MDWEQRFVSWDEDRSIEITVAKDWGARWYWQALAFFNGEATSLKMRHGYRSAESAKRGAENWHYGHVLASQKAG